FGSLAVKPLDLLTTKRSGEEFVGTVGGENQSKPKGEIRRQRKFFKSSEGGGVASLAGSATRGDLEFFRSPVNVRKRRRKESTECHRERLLSFTSSVIPVQRRREAAGVTGASGEKCWEKLSSA
ncbi:hypothetical protein U1Q18_048053, partial [Sarracenia purpurea var. burkii]